MNRPLASTLVAAMAVGLGALTASAIPRDAEEVIFYPTYGVQQGSDWRIDVRAKVQQRRDVATAIATLFRRIPAGNARERANLEDRLADFVKSRRTIPWCICWCKLES